MRFVFTVVSVIWVGMAFAVPRDSLRAERRAEGLFVVHQVEEKETIYSIAKRYGGSVESIIKHNQIKDNRIEIGQIIYVLVEKENTSEPKETNQANIHVVAAGETLYSISRQHNIKLKDLRKWNNLTDNNISLGMKLKLSGEVEDRLPANEEENTAANLAKEKTDTLVKDADVPSFPTEEFQKYLVQTGETLATIAERIKVSIDSLRTWNRLDGDYLKIGQELRYKKTDESPVTTINKPNEKRRVKIDEKGFERVYEEGIASVIESMNTTKFLALHRTLPIGTNLQVRNLMNNQVVHVKVIGTLPNTGVNKNILLRLSRPAYDQLGILDSKARVEVSYSK